MTEDDSQPGPPPRSQSLRRGLLALLVVLLLAASAAAAYLSSDRSVPALGIEGEQESLQAQRDQVRAQAEQFMLRVNTYSPDLLAEDGTMPKYRQLVEEVITPKFAVDFEKAVPLTEQVVQQSRITLTCTVFSSAVSVIDADSATALVAGATTSTVPGKGGDDPGVLSQPSQMQLSLVKTDGRWLVDDFSPLTAAEQPSEGASPSSEPTPSGGDE